MKLKNFLGEKNYWRFYGVPKCKLFLWLLSQHDRLFWSQHFKWMWTHWMNLWLLRNI